MGFNIRIQGTHLAHGSLFGTQRGLVSEPKQNNTHPVHMGTDGPQRLRGPLKGAAWGRLGSVPLPPGAALPQVTVTALRGRRPFWGGSEKGGEGVGLGWECPTCPEARSPLSQFPGGRGQARCTKSLAHKPSGTSHHLQNRRGREANTCFGETPQPCPSERQDHLGTTFLQPLKSSGLSGPAPQELMTSFCMKIELFPVGGEE